MADPTAAELSSIAGGEDRASSSASTWDARAKSETPMSIDPRSATPLQRYGAGWSSSASTTEQTPTPQQWAREYDSRKQQPARCATAMGGPVQETGLESVPRPQSSLDVRHTSQPWQTKTHHQAEEHTADDEEDDALVTAALSTTVGTLVQDSETDDFLAELTHIPHKPGAASPTGAVTMGMTDAMSSHGHDEQWDSPRSSPRKMRFDHRKSLAFSYREIADCLADNVNGASLELRKGIKPRSLRWPSSAPPKMGPPLVVPHNTWRTCVEWVPPAGSHEDPDFGYALNCRMEGSKHIMTLDDLGAVPRAQFDHLEAGQIYYFQVCARNNVGYSAWSNWSEGYLVPAPPHALKDRKDTWDSADVLPAKIGQPHHFSESPTSATLEWDEPCDQGSEIMGYCIQYCLDPEDPHGIQTTSVLGRQNWVQITQLLPNRTYYFRTQTINQVGESDWTEWSLGVSTKAVEPEAPNPPVLFEAHTNELIVRWEPPYSCGFRIIHYDVRISKKDPTMGNALLLPMGDETEALESCKLRVVDIEPNTDFYFQIRARSEIGTSEWSEPSLPMRTRMALPGAPEDVRVVESSLGLVMVEWVTPDGYGEPIDGFVVRWLDAVHPHREHDRIQVPAYNPELGKAVAVQVKGIVPGSKLNFQVAARTKAGLGPFSRKSPDILATPGVPGQPPRPTVALRTTTSMQIIVDEASEDNGDCIIRYEARYDTRPDFGNPVTVMGDMQLAPRRSPGLPRRFTVAATGLRKRGPYYFSVRCFNRVGSSPWSLPSEGQILHFDGPSRMASPHLVQSLHQSLLVGYVPSAELGVYKGGGLHEFEMRYTRWPELMEAKAADDDAATDKVRFMRWTAPEFGATTPEPLLVQNLLMGRSYYFQARCVSEFGAGPWSYVSLPFEVLPEAPEKPLEPGVDKGTDSPYSIQLAMTLPESNGRPITSCKLRIKGPVWADRPHVVAEWQDLYTIKDGDIETHRHRRLPVEDATDPDFVDIWTHTVIYLEPGAFYQFKFSCTNCMGDSQWSEPSQPIGTAPTVPDRCEAPYCETEEDCTAHTLKLNWKPPHNGGSDLTHYTVHWATNPSFKAVKEVDFIPEAEVTLKNLMPYQWYYVKVSASNGIGQGKFSDLNTNVSDLGCFLTKACVPSPVLNITAELTEDEEVVVRWSKPPCTGGHLITRYRVQASKDRLFNSFEQEVVQKSQRECTFMNLAPDTVFFFEVRAANSVGYSEPSGKPAMVQMRAVPKNKEVPPKIPAAPACSLFANDRGKPMIQVTWACPEMYHHTKGFIYKVGVQTHMILSYNVKIVAGDPTGEDPEEVQVRKDIKQVRDRRTVPKDDGNTCVFPEILYGRHYTASVQAVNEFHCSQWSPMSEGVWSSAGAPDAPFSLTCIERHHTSLLVSWQSPPGNGEDVIAFQVRIKAKRYLGRESAGGKSSDSKRGSSKNSSAAADENSSATDSANADDWSDENSDGDSSSSSASPAKDVKQEPGICVRLETVKYGEAPELVGNDFSPRGRGFEGQECRWELKGLMPGRYYIFEVRAMNAAGFGPWMSSEILRTCPQVPDPPTTCKGQAGVTLNSVTFTWEAPSETGGEEIEGYEVRWTAMDYDRTATADPSLSINYDTMRERCDMGPNQLSYIAEGLLPGQVALPVVRCWNMVGYSNWCKLPMNAAQMKALCTLPTVPSPVGTLPTVSSPVARRPALVKRPAKDHRPYSLTAVWHCPKINGCPIQTFLVRIQQTTSIPWVGNASLGPGKDVKEFTIDYQGSGGGWIDGTQVEVDFVHEDLVAGMPYIFCVRGRSEIGWCEDWGVASLPELAPPDLPLQPAAPRSPWQWPTALEIKWKEPCMSGAAWSGVDARFSRNADMKPLQQVGLEICQQAVIDGDDKLVVSDLPCSTPFYFQLRMQNEVGWSPWSDVTPPFVTKACRPASPANMRCVNPETMLEGVISTTWEAPDNHGAEIFTYELILADSIRVPDFQALVDRINSAADEEEREKDFKAILQSAPIEYTVRPVESFGAALEHLFQGVLGGVTYHAAVRARNSEGASDYSELVTMRTEIMAPEQCPPLVLKKVGQTSLLVEYSLPYDNGDPIVSLEFFWIFVDGPRERHIVQRNMLFGVPDDEQEDREVPSGTLTLKLPVPAPERAKPHSIGGSGQILIQHLDPGAEYNLQVCAINAFGQGPFSEAVRMKCNPGKPDAPDRVRPVALPPPPNPMARGLPPSAGWSDESRAILDPPTVTFHQTDRLQRDEVVKVGGLRRKNSKSSILNALGWRSTSSTEVVRILPEYRER